MASSRDKTAFLLSSLDAYVGGTAAGNLVAYTAPGSTFRHTRDIATAESSLDGKRIAVRRDEIRKGAEFEGAFMQFDIDTLQLILGGTVATGSGYTRLYFGHGSDLPAEVQWAFKGRRVDGQMLWLVFPKAQCLTPIEVPMGGEEHANIPFSIGANIDETMTGAGEDEQNIYYWQLND